MFDSDYSQIVSQTFQQKKQKKKNVKPVYRELLETEKTSFLNFQFNDNRDHRERHGDIKPLKTKTLSFTEKKQLKQNYLQGNFRFFVNPEYEENITYVDPDKEIRWKTIEMMKYITNNLIACPICLNEHYDMVFPKITRCGHMFCWPCILKYLSLKHSKCPLCDDFLNEEDLRTVQIVYYPAIKPGEKIHFKLKKRRKSSNIVYNGKDLIEEEDFIRIKKIGWDEILKLKEEETKSLIDYLSILEIEKDYDTKPYFERALHNLDSSMERIHEAHKQVKHKKNKHHIEDKKDDEASNGEEFLYFYQEIHGLNIFLHPVNNKYIKLQFSDCKDLPSLIEAPLIENVGFQQTEVSQRRYKFLNHMPLNSDINFAEIDMKDIISKELNDALIEELKIHKESSTKKDLANNLLERQASTPLPPKTITVANEGKYQIEFPMSPSGLKLNDKFDYPELSSINVEASSNTKNAWNDLAPPKKKKQEEKTNTSQPLFGSKNGTSHVGPDEKENKQSDKVKSKIDLNNATPSENGWKTAKADKLF